MALGVRREKCAQGTQDYLMNMGKHTAGTPQENLIKTVTEKLSGPGGLIWICDDTINTQKTYRFSDIDLDTARSWLSDSD